MDHVTLDAEALPAAPAPAATAAPAPMPVQTLRYGHDDGAPWPLEVKALVLAAMVSAGFSLVTFGTSVWIWFQPALFRTVGSFQSMASAEALTGALHGLVGMAMLAGGTAFLMRRRGGRWMLAWAAIATVASQAIVFAYYMFGRVGGGPRYGADLLVWAAWRLAWSFNAAVVPLLVLVLVTRPHVKARFRAAGV
jgi:hypothetical protein